MSQRRMNFMKCEGNICEEDIRLLLVEIKTEQEDMSRRLGKIEEVMSCDVHREKLRILEKMVVGVITCMCVLTLMVLTATYSQISKHTERPKVEQVYGK